MSRYLASDRQHQLLLAPGRNVHARQGRDGAQVAAFQARHHTSQTTTAQAGAQRFADSLFLRPQQQKTIRISAYPISLARVEPVRGQGCGGKLTFGFHVDADRTVRAERDHGDVAGVAYGEVDAAGRGGSPAGLTAQVFLRTTKCPCGKGPGIPGPAQPHTHPRLQFAHERKCTR